MTWSDGEASSGPPRWGVPPSPSDRTAGAPCHAARRLHLPVPADYLYSSGAILLESMFDLSYQKNPVSVNFGNFSPLSAFTAASTHL